MTWARLRLPVALGLLCAAAAGCENADQDAARSARIQALLVSPRVQPADPPASTATSAAPGSAAGVLRASARRAPVVRATEENGISVEDAQRLEENEGGCLNEDVAAFKSIRTMTEEFPWGSERWNGTGHPDPGPLRAVTNAEMLRRAAEAVGPDREHALVSIGRRRLPEALDVIARAQFHDQPQAVREMALSALIEHGGPDALPLMWRAVTDPSEYVRGMAVWAIALYGHAEAVKAIQAALDDQHAYVVGMGILATTALRDEADFWPIMDRVIGSDEQVIFQEAAYVLSQIDSEFARDYLRREYDRSKDNRRATFRFYLRESLRKRLY